MTQYMNNNEDLSWIQYVCRQTCILGVRGWVLSCRLDDCSFVVWSILYMISHKPLFVTPSLVV